MRRGVTLMELVVVLVIVTLTAAIFHSLIGQMIDSALFLLGGKASYQQGKEALKRMADEIRYNIRGGIHHNFGVVTAGFWQTTSIPCADSRFTFFPGLLPGQIIPTQKVSFEWVGTVTGLPSPRWYLRFLDERTTPTDTVLAGVVNNTQGSLIVRYYDDDETDGNNTPISAGSGLTDIDARRVTRIELLLTLNQGGRAVTLSETIFVRQKGVPPRDAAWL